jgi:hypothetical protein
MGIVIGDEVTIYNPTRKSHLKKGSVCLIINENVKYNIKVNFDDCYGYFNEVELEKAGEHKMEEASKESYYLQCCDDLLSWECVDKHTFDNYAHALNAENNLRYTGNKVIIDNRSENANIIASDLSKRELAVVMRFCGVRGNEATGIASGGFVKKPEFVQFKKGKKIWLHKMNGDDFVARKTKEATKEIVSQINSELSLYNETQNVQK